MWGVTFVADALIRTALVFILPISVFLVASQALLYGMFAITFAVTFAYGRRVQRAGEGRGQPPPEVKAHSAGFTSPDS